jgi:hypothetical protein
MVESRGASSRAAVGAAAWAARCALAGNAGWDITTIGVDASSPMGAGEALIDGKMQDDAAPAGLRHLRHRDSR